MTTAHSLNSCRTLQQVSHLEVTSLCMWSSEGHFKRPCQRDRILDRISDPIFGSYPATLFSQQRAYKLANVSHTLVSKVETIAVCERERVAHVCCAALAQCMPVHAHYGAYACSVPQEERKSQCTICQSCNLKLPRRCQSNTQFCALCRFGRQTCTWEGACAYGLFATLFGSSKPTSDPARSPTCVRLSV